MKKIFFAFAFFCAALLGFSYAKAAPAPWGLAINTETKECAGFWAGDEFVAYKLPEGWKAYYPTYDSSSQSRWSNVQTEVGECSFQIRKEEACCMELGYKYISDNIGKDQKTILRDRKEFEKELAQHRGKSNVNANWIIPILLFVFAIVVIFIRSIRKKNKHIAKPDSKK
jgi:hypothetical protein